MIKDSEEDDNLTIAWSKPNEPTKWTDSDTDHGFINIEPHGKIGTDSWIDMRDLKSRTYVYDSETSLKIDFPKAERFVESGHFIIDCTNAIWFIPDEWIAMRNEFVKEPELVFENDG